MMIITYANAAPKLVSPSIELPVYLSFTTGSHVGTCSVYVDMHMQTHMRLFGMLYMWTLYNSTDCFNALQ